MKFTLLKSPAMRMFAVGIGVLSALSPTISFAAAVKIADGTEVPLKLKHDLASGRSKVGEEVRAEVRRDVKGPNGEVVIARGAQAIGKVTESRGSRAFGGRGKLEFTIETVKAVDGTEINLRGSQASKGRSGSTAAVATIAFVSVFGAFIRGKNVHLKEGTEFKAFVDEDVTVRTDGSVADTQDGNREKAAPNAKLRTFKLKGGDVIKGKIISFADGVYKVETSVGVVSIDEEKVVSMSDAGAR
jgi:hypothetical protein